MASHTRDIKETEVEQRKQAMRQEIMEEAWQQNLVGGYDNAGFVLEPSLSTVSAAVTTNNNELFPKSCNCHGTIDVM